MSIPHDFSAKIVLDSVSPYGHRLTTFQVTYPRFILAEMNTHRAFCLDGDTQVYFDLPSGPKENARNVYKLSMKKLWEKWSEGGVYENTLSLADTSLVQPDLEYTTTQLAGILGVNRQVVHRACKKKGLPHRVIGVGKQSTLYVVGKDFIRWAESPESKSCNPQQDRIKSMRIRNVNEDTNEIGHSHIKEVFYNGPMPMYKITAGKYSIVCSENHQIYTDKGMLTLRDALNPTTISTTGEIAFTSGVKLGCNGVLYWRDPAWLQARRDEGMSAKAIAEMVGVSEYAIKGMFRTHKTKFTDPKKVRSGRTPWNKGVSYVNLRGRGKSTSAYVKRGADSHFWRGGVLTERGKRTQWTLSVARQVHTSTNYKCACCGSQQNPHVHHIDPVWNCPDKVYDLNNVTTVCKKCHIRIHANHLEMEFRDLYLAGGDTKNFWELYATTKNPAPPISRPSVDSQGHYVVKFVEVNKVEYMGVRDSYDLEVEGPYHNFVANGIVVHNSRNTASSRAIPAKKLIEHVREHGYVPSDVAVNKAGMQAGEPLSQDQQEDFALEWTAAKDRACSSAEDLLTTGAHKQWVNRVIEPYMWTTQLISSTDYDNFFMLRNHEMAQPEMQVIARLMFEAYQNSTPTHRTYHIPLTEDLEKTVPMRECFDEVKMNSNIIGILHTVTRKMETPNEVTTAKMLVSAARCARLSYVSHDSEKVDFGKDMDLVFRLAGSNPKHLSPFEHIAVCSPVAVRHPHLCRNYRAGWAQLRAVIENV